MPDIQMRFHHDMLVLSAPVSAALARQGMEDESDRALACLLEPETVQGALRLESSAGAACLVTPTDGITDARLSHARMEGRGGELARAAQAIVREFKPQHTLAQIGPTMLPIDASSKTSLMANRDQYARAVAGFEAAELDAFFFNGMQSVADVKCACMGTRRECATPLFVSVDVDVEGCIVNRQETAVEAAQAAQDLEADVFGVRVDCELDSAAAIVQRLAAAVEIPLLVQFAVPESPADVVAAKRFDRVRLPYSSPDDMMAAAAAMRAAGAQFLRADGSATPAFTGALAAAVYGLDAIR